MLSLSLTILRTFEKEQVLKTGGTAILYAFLALIAVALDLILIGHATRVWPLMETMLVAYASGAATSALLLRGSPVTDIKSLPRVAAPFAVFMIGSLFAGCGMFYLIHVLGLSGNTVLGQMAHVFLIMYGILILKEKVNLRDGIIAAGLFAGIVLFFAEKSSFNAVSIYCGIGAALAATFVGAARKHLSARLDHAFLTFSRATFLTLSLVFYCLFFSPSTFQSLAHLSFASSSGLFISMAIGVVGVGLYHIFAHKALRLLDLSRYEAIMMALPLILIMYDYCILAEPLTQLQWLGVIVTFGIKTLYLVPVQLFNDAASQLHLRMAGFRMAGQKQTTLRTY